MFDEDVIAKTKELCPKCQYPLDYDGLIASYVCPVCDYGRCRRGLFPSDYDRS